ncbi:MAG: glycosyltransferase, partial [Cryobacterium sp.]|nr:glycosyltransferase [Cryobacterium sp.]
MKRRIELLEHDRDLDRSQNQTGRDVARDLVSARAASDYQAAWDGEDPLVTVIVATHNRGQLLVERSLASLVDQDHKKLQILVIGDRCSDNTRELVEGMGDPRIAFHDLQDRDEYPEDSLRRWMVAGSPAMNLGLELAAGEWVTHLDDDDSHAPRRISTLLEVARLERAEVLWHPFRYQDHDYEWHVRDSREFAPGEVTTSSIFYHRWFTRFPWDTESHYLGEPGDWGRLRNFLFVGARTARC